MLNWEKMNFGKTSLPIWSVWNISLEFNQMKTITFQPAWLDLMPRMLRNLANRAEGLHKTPRPWKILIATLCIHTHKYTKRKQCCKKCKNTENNVTFFFARTWCLSLSKAISLSLFFGWIPLVSCRNPILKISTQSLEVLGGKNCLQKWSQIFFVHRTCHFWIRSCTLHVECWPWSAGRLKAFMY